MKTEVLVVIFIYFALSIVLISAMLIIEKGRKKKLGKINESISIGILNQHSTKYYLGISLLVSAIYFVFIYISSPKMILPNTIFQLMIISIILYSSYVTTFIHFGKNGVMFPTFNYLNWNELSKFEWDSDIKQELCGLKIYSVGKDKPYKIYVPRKIKETLDKKFRLYNKKKK